MHIFWSTRYFKYAARTKKYAIVMTKVAGECGHCFSDGFGWIALVSMDVWMVLKVDECSYFEEVSSRGVCMSFRVCFQGRIIWIWFAFGCSVLSFCEVA